ncbi:MAG: uroporphyrinogen decarboxylase family protein [Candidatus Omnitrophica bacterium]|nr:uroporphyrinogen decarboxylase family protein [Candidatus Omnitrophota bacterium]
MTPRKRVVAALKGEKVDKIPFTIYESKLPQCSIERQLRNEGLCIVNRNYPVFKVVSPNVSYESRSYTEKGISYVRHFIKTKYGDLTYLTKPAGFTSWTVEKIFKGPEDYKKLYEMIKDQRYEPDYENFLKAEKELGEDVILRAGIGASPLHQIMIGWMGVETFAIEWIERRDEIEKLVEIQVKKLRMIYEIVAKSPALIANFGGNETGSVMGRERYEKYVLPYHNEAAEVFHRYGKLLGCHLDGNNKVWADLVAKSGLDYIEAFSPAPDTDMTFEEAFEMWKDKVLWINFPSSLHLASIEEIEKTTQEFINISKGSRLIIGITEDIPEDRWQENLLAISRVINKNNFG